MVRDWVRYSICCHGLSIFYYSKLLYWYAGTGQGPLDDYTVALVNGKRVVIRQAYSPHDYWQPDADFGNDYADPGLHGSR
jgi:hypothetical protein